MDRGIVLQGQRAVHVGFGGVELRIDEQLGMELAVVQVNGDVGAGQAISEYVHVSVGVADSQRTLVNETPKQVGQQTHVAVLRNRLSPYNITMNPKGVTRCRMNIAEFAGIRLRPNSARPARSAADGIRCLLRPAL